MVMRRSDKNKVRQYVSFIVCLLLMAAVAVSRDGRLLGHDLGKQEAEETTASVVTGEDGSITVNTTGIAKDVIGYNGPTPVEITIREGRIVGVRPLANHETPGFFSAVANSDLLESWNGKTLQEAAETRADAVTGATMSSVALIRNVELGIGYALDNGITAKAAQGEVLTPKFVVVLLIILAGAVVPLFFRSKGYRTAQLVLNVVLLGFWGGTFVSYSLMTSYMANGIGSWALLPWGVLLIAAFVYPLFGKKEHYCTWLCPYGSLQELVGKCGGKKIRMSAKTVKRLMLFRKVLWFVLMLLLWTGLWFDWMDYEPFTAFFFKDASPIVLVIAGLFLILSFFVPRPYCRFVCPTGTLMKTAEDN